MILTIWVMISLLLRRSVKTDKKEKKAWRRRREFHKRMTVIMATLTAGWRESRVSSELTENISAFLLCWWPYAIYFMSRGGDVKVLGKLIILAYLNSLINPCLYIVINKDVRTRIKNILSFNNLSRQEEFQDIS